MVLKEEKRKVATNEFGIYLNDGVTECKNYLFFKPIIPNASAVLFKKAAVEKITPEFLDYKICGDWSFWISICRQGKIAYLDKCLNFFRQSSTSVSRSNTHHANARKTFLLEYLKIAVNLKKSIKPFPAYNSIRFLQAYWQIIIRENLKGIVNFDKNEILFILKESMFLSPLNPIIAFGALLKISSGSLKKLINHE